MLDPLGVKTKTRAATEEVVRATCNASLCQLILCGYFQAKGPEDAPETITGREELDRTKKENYFYSPGMGEVPEIAVPDTLPDLLGLK